MSEYIIREMDGMDGYNHFTGRQKSGYPIQMSTTSFYIRLSKKSPLGIP